MFGIENIGNILKSIFNNEGIGKKSDDLEVLDIPEKKSKPTGVPGLIKKKSKKIDFNTMTKKQLEEHGRGLGIELDRRHNKKKLIQTLKAANV